MIKIFIKLSLVVTLLGVLFATTQAQEKLTYDELDKYIEKSVEDYAMPGLAIGIIKNNEIVLLKGYGYSNTETKMNAFDHMPYL